MLQIVKASAGSGKTFHLVLEYLRLILTTKSGFRQILAITFTNKATAEMKERILSQLGKFARGESTTYLDLLVKNTGKPEHYLRQKAASVLETLLFDFNRFSVSTIDKFTQRILKTFYREMKINPGFQVETDIDLLLTEAVDRLISKAGNQPGLFRWLKDFVEEKMENNKSFSIEKDLYSLGLELFREKLQSAIDELSRFVNDGNSAREYMKTLTLVIKGYEKQLKEQAGALVRIYSEAGFHSEDFANKSRGLGAFLEKLEQGEKPEKMAAKLDGWVSSPDNWVLAKHKRYGEFRKLTGDSLLPLLKNLHELVRRDSGKVNTAKVIRNEWFTAALMVDLNEEIRALGKEKGVLPLSDSNILLKKVIDGSETPFIYEKAGNAWHHFMLDEFQDTSELQWENLRPLLINSVSDDRFSLVVGDVKQSIYRWRNSNWDILKQKIREDFRNFPLEEITLRSNFRSGKNVVNFNNAFFTLFSQRMAESQKLNGAPEYREKLLDIYGDIIQKHSPGEAPDGFVSVEAIPVAEGDFQGLSAARLTEQVKEMYNLGYKPGDMAILVRKNDQGTFLVNHFLNVSELPENQNYNFRIISGESLLLKSSAAVGFIVSLFRHLLDRNNRLFKASLLHLYLSGPQRAISLHEGSVSASPESNLDHDFELRFEEILRPRIIEMEEKSRISALDELIVHAGKTFHLFDFPGELPFLQNLTDRAAELKKSGINDIAGFIRWWDEKGIKSAVQLNDQIDAIRLFSVHKAKGLEFKVVFIPFADWTIVDFGNSLDRKKILWCKPTVAPFNAAPLVPVRFSADLEDSLFAEEYFTEVSNVLVDNLNVVYVAFTRAISVLRVNIPDVQRDNKMGTLITQTIRELCSQPGFELSWDEEKNTFTSGAIPVVKYKKKEGEMPSSTEWVFHDFSEKLRLKPGSDEFFERTETGDFRKNQGNILHTILSAIVVDTDVESACKQAMASGILLPEEGEKTLSKLTEMVRHPVAGSWFSGDWKVLTENDLLTTEDIYRPDRIMIRDGRAVVVDYKTGDRRDSHVRQVKRYSELLRESGIPEVRGYLWYIRENDLVEV